MAGQVASIVIFTAVVVLSLIGWHMVYHCKARSQMGAKSFGDIGDEAFGNRGRTLIEGSVVLTQLAVCTVFVSFLATNICAVLPYSRLDVIAVATPAFLVLGNLKNLKVLAPLSMIANACLVASFAIVVYYCTAYAEAGGEQKPLSSSMSGIALFFGNCSYSFEGVALVLPIENAVHPRLRRRSGDFHRLLNIGMVAIVSCFLLVGALPLVTFGAVSSSSMAAELASRYSADTPAVLLCNLLLVANVTFTYPLQFLPAMQVVDQWLQPPSGGRRSLYRSSSESESGPADPLLADSLDPCASDNWAGSAASAASAASAGSASSAGSSAALAQEKRAALDGDSELSGAQLPTDGASGTGRAIVRRCLAILGTAVLAAAVPDLGLLISLFGSVASSVLGFIMPPLLFLKLVSPQTAATRVFCYGMSLFGIIGGVTGFCSALLAIIHTYD
jgi:proton-coupled amino acid transporter